MTKSQSHTQTKVTETKKEDTQPLASNTVIQGSQLELSDLTNLDLTNLNADGVAKVKDFVDKLQEYLSPEEKEYYRNKRLEQQKKADQKKDKFDEQLEQAASIEEFEIPKGSGKRYAFIGYDNQQYVELMEIANSYDAVPVKDRGTKENLQLEMKIYKMMIKFSLRGITDEQIEKIPLRELQWYYRLFKKKNEEPLPFGQKG